MLFATGIVLRRVSCLALLAATSSSTLAQSGPIGDGGLATQAQLFAPGKVAIDRNGNIYVSERSGYRVRRVDVRTGTITTVAGTGEKGFSGDGGPAIAARFDQLSGIAVDSGGNLYIGDLWNSRIRRVDARTGIVSTIAGTGTAGYSGDGGAATRAAISAAFDLLFDREGNLLFTDTENHRVRRIDAGTGIITTIAGNGQYTSSGDGGPATLASFARPHCIFLTPDDDLYICDQTPRIRRVDGRTGRISTVAGSGHFGSGGDDGPAIDAAITYPGDLAMDTTGSLLFSDIATHRIRRIDRHTGIITTIAGDGIARFAGDGGGAKEASFDLPSGLRLDTTGSLLVADMWNGRIRRIDSRTGTISTVAGRNLSPETPDWRFRTTYDRTAARASSNQPPALEHPDAGRVSVTPLAFRRGTGETPGLMSIFTPPGAAPTGGHPVLVLVHGRSNQEIRPRNSGGMNAWARLLAASGFVVILPDHRLGLGGLSAEPATADVRSAVAAVRSEAKRFFADADRLCYWTFSDGIGIVVPLLRERATRPRCLVTFYPMTDLTDDRIPGFAGWRIEPDYIRRRGSLLHAATAPGFMIPTFIARGARDRPEILEPLARLEQQASANGVPVTIVTHSTGEHGFDRGTPGQESASIIRQAIDFARRLIR